MSFGFVERLAKMNVRRTVAITIKVPEVEDQIIFYNTEAQLFQKGEDSKGVKLSDIGGNYSPLTVKIKKVKGQPTNRVTLLDTGAFYGTFKVKALPSGDFEITANPRKDNDNLFDDWGEDIVGLQEENLKKILEMIEQIILDNIFAV